MENHKNASLSYRISHIIIQYDPVGSNAAYIGISRENTAEPWRDTRGDLLGYTNWDPLDWVEVDGVDCGYMIVNQFRIARNGKWGKQPCSTRPNYYICEIG